MNNLFKFLLAVLIPGVWAGRIFANGFTLGDQDAFATARGGAFVATADNPSAIYYNPAGIAQLDGDNLRGGVYGIYLDQTYSPPGGAAKYYNSDNFAAVPQGFYTHSFKNTPFSMGLGVYSPYGGNINWPQNTSLYTDGVNGRLTYFTINPVIAVKLSPSLLLGAGLAANYADLNFQQGLRAYNSRFIDSFSFTGNGWSMGYNLGALWQPMKQISFGATFRSAAPVTLRGNSHFEENTAGVASTTLPAQMALTFPLSAVFGVSYRPTPKWNLEFDANYTDWASFGQTTLYQTGTPPPGVLLNVPVTFDWQDSWVFEWGITRYFNNGWHVSAGYTFDENSVPNEYYTPLAADLDRDFFSIGAGFAGKLLNFDITYQFGYGPPLTVTGSNPTTPLGLFIPVQHPADGKYGFNSSAVMLTAGIHF